MELHDVVWAAIGFAAGAPVGFIMAHWEKVIETITGET